MPQVRGMERTSAVLGSGREEVEMSHSGGMREVISASLRSRMSCHED